MTDDIRSKVESRVRRRVSSSPRAATLHALLFTAFTVLLGLLSLLLPPLGVMNGVIYWTIFFWSLVLLGHVGYVYSRSGARRIARDRIISEELLDAADLYDLDEDELIDLHVNIAKTIETEAQPHNRLFVNALGNAAFWPGMLIFMLIVQRIVAATTGADDYVGLLFTVGELLSLLGTAALGLILPLKILRTPATQRYDNLHAIYGYKRKRRKNDDALSVGDDGELVLEAEVESETPLPQIDGEDVPHKRQM